MSRIVLISLSLALTASVGCNFKPVGKATMVSRNTAGGVLALSGDETAAMNDAKAQMAAQCGPYTIVSEEMVVVGAATQEETSTERNRRRSVWDRADERQQTQSVSKDLTEHRVTYTCGAPEGLAAATPAPAADATVPAEEAPVADEAAAKPAP
jgi:hypothetical protein